jgi:hypothetical protein
VPFVSKDRVREVATNKPNAATAFNLPDAPAASLQSFDTAYANSATMECMATNGTDWESFIGTFSAGTPDTLTRSKLLASSTGAFIDWSSGGDVSVFGTTSSREFNSLHTLSRSYISGLGLEWNSATAITVKQGAAFVEEADSVIALVADQSISPTLTASAWHYVYLKEDGSCEVSTTAPLVFNGTAKSKNSAGNKWRLIGQFVTNASSQILEFQHNASASKWTYPRAGDTPYRLVSNTNTTVTLQQSLASFVPPFCNLVTLKLSNNATSGGGAGWLIGDGRTPIATTTCFFIVANGVRSSGDFPCNDAQQISHMYAGVPAGGGGYLDVLGYMVGR